MSPFALFLKELRLRSRLRQHEVAKLLGYEQAYVSSIELGIKPPSNEFVERLSRQLDLSESDRADIQQAIHESRRRFVLPAEVSPETFQLCNELWNKIDRLYPAQIQAIRQMIRLDEEIEHASIRPAARIGRKSKAEADM